MILGKPTLCFDKACGLANFIKTKPDLAEFLVSDYLNIEMMARQVTDIKK